MFELIRVSKENGFPRKHRGWFASGYEHGWYNHLWKSGERILDGAAFSDVSYQVVLQPKIVSCETNILYCVSEGRTVKVLLTKEELSIMEI